LTPDSANASAVFRFDIYEVRMKTGEKSNKPGRVRKAKIASLKNR